ncbi:MULTISPECIES: hypothetical protein [unclassified Mesorhizobium]|uniref:hypothetical protein n=1 Tax=unclassified Mesorhizobium TaxID=325217 RepID=UPI000FCC657D|nr:MULTISPECIES: hypothetical protein [unclassified Mesorhizobium]RUX91124.1 hypothetical protein EN993_28190 [Mesorhizobium sp. M7D.F.Ca.US.004.01.2.1]RVA23042.1 hypothetical protein EN935_28765 [Mesorhizobium sp. M7D.F.Ca.US.004.03.1.1]
MMEIASAPWPLLEIAIEPKSEADEEKLRIALSSLADEDLGFRFTWDEEAGQTTVSGNAELQLDLIIHRLVNEFEVALNISAPDVAYRETITRKHEQDYTHKKQSHGMGQFARVKLLFEPNGHDPEFVFVSRIPNGAVRDEHAVGVEKGVRSALVSGPFAGSPMIGLKATLVDGAFHQTDSSALAFEIAGRACFREAAPRLGVQLLEPITEVEVVTPEYSVRGIVSDLKGRRGRIQGQEGLGTDIKIDALVPLTNMFKLEDTLRLLSKGQARLSVRYFGYAPVPGPFPDDEPPPAVAAYG